MNSQHKIGLLRQEVDYRFGCLRNLISTVEEWAEASEQDERQALLEWGRAQGYDVDNMTIPELRGKRVGFAITDPSKYGGVDKYRSIPSWSDKNKHTAYSSILLMIVATFEDTQQRVLYVSGDIYDVERNPDEIHGGSGDRFKEYIKKYLEIEYDFGKSERWSKMKSHYKVRNFIAHNGDFKDDSSESKKAIDECEKIEYLSFGLDERLLVSRKYLVSVLEDSKKFVEDIIDDMEGLIKE